MDRYGIQINKTSRNSVLFMTNIGTTRSSVAFLVEVLVNIARELDQDISEMSLGEREHFEQAVYRLTEMSLPLPDFSGFHPAFLDHSGSEPTPEGDVRRAFYLSYDDTNCEYLTGEQIDERLDAGVDIVSATYVTPYPPGFPVLVPGQVFSREILQFMRDLDTPEIHGYLPNFGYRVYTEKAIEMVGAAAGLTVQRARLRGTHRRAGAAGKTPKKKSAKRGAERRSATFPRSVRTSCSASSSPATRSPRHLRPALKTSPRSVQKNSSASSTPAARWIPPPRLDGAADSGLRRKSVFDDGQRALGPSNVFLFERYSAQQRQVRANPFGLGQVLLFAAAVEQAGPQPLVALQFGGGPLQSFEDEFADGLRVAGIGGLDLDQQLIADHRGLRRPCGELLDRVAARLGQGEHALVRPAFLVNNPRLDEPLLGEPVEFAIQLLWGGHPEVRHRGIEAFRQVVSGGLALEECGQHRVTKRHRLIVQRHE